MGWCATWGPPSPSPPTPARFTRRPSPRSEFRLRLLHRQLGDGAREGGRIRAELADIDRLGPAVTRMVKQVGAANHREVTRAIAVDRARFAARQGPGIGEVIDGEALRLERRAGPARDRRLRSVEEVLLVRHADVGAVVDPELRALGQVRAPRQVVFDADEAGPLGGEGGDEQVY